MDWGGGEGGSTTVCGGERCGVCGLWCDVKWVVWVVRVHELGDVQLLPDLPWAKTLGEGNHGIDDKAGACGGGGKVVGDGGKYGVM